MAKTRVLSGRTRVLEEPTPIARQSQPVEEPIPRFALDRRSATVATVGGLCLLLLLGIGVDRVAPDLRLNPVTALRLAILGGSAPRAPGAPGATCGASASC